MKVLVCGSRDWTNEFLMNAILMEYAFAFCMPDVDVLIEGEARGADLMARDWAERRGIAVWPFPAQWGQYGRAAGPIRNKQMLEEGEPDLVIAFSCRPLSESRGTANMVQQARAAGVETIVIEHVV